jgi:hypothetical protein
MNSISARPPGRTKIERKALEKPSGSTAVRVALAVPLAPDEEVSSPLTLTKTPAVVAPTGRPDRHRRRARRSAAPRDRQKAPA